MIVGFFYGFFLKEKIGKVFERAVKLLSMIFSNNLTYEPGLSLIQKTQFDNNPSTLVSFVLLS
ncbi:MAG: hypothetical protein EA391_07365 [Balneolaceae bacterium]|nr:MAG: hypothetical protein EA391_07365 [Balneolaceae bacterium]